MSFEAVAYVRKRGAIGEFAQKWLTVPSDDRAAAVTAFNALGFEVRGVTIMPQEEATAMAERIGQ